MISNNIFTSDIVSGQHFYSDKLIARTPQGLHIVDDEDNGMFLEDGGNIGIGTTDPSHNLHIAGGTPSMKLEGSQPRIWLRETDQTDLNTLIRNNNSIFEIDTVSDTDAYIQNRFAINHGNGNVRINDLLGIGKDPDGYHLDVAAPGASGNGIRVQTNDASANAIVHIGGGGSADIKFKVDGSGNVTTAKDVTIGGNLTVNGTTTTVNSTTLTVDDKNIELGSVDTPTNTTADGGGITLKGATDKEFKWTNASNAWNSSEKIGIADGKYLFTDKVRARDSAGLRVEDDGGNGIFIQDGGDVGIGTTEPDEKLHINGTVKATRAKLADLDIRSFFESESEITDFLDASSTSKFGTIIETNPNGQMIFGIRGNDENDAFRILTKNYATSISDESSRPYNHSALCVDSNGNVGIGATNPEAQLHIKGSDSSDQIIIENNNNDSAHAPDLILYKKKLDSNGDRVAVSDNELLGHLQFRASNASSAHNYGSILCRSIDATDSQEVGVMAFYVSDNGSNQEQMRIAGGNVGIGTTSPNTVLHVTSPVGNGDGTVFIENTLADYGMGLKVKGGGNVDDERFALKVQNAAGDDILFAQSKTGNVGIGTTSPAFLLDLVQKDGGVQLQMGRSNTSAGSAWMGADSNGFHLGVGAYASAGGDVANPNGFSVDTSGNVGIGTGSPEEPLDVRGTIKTKNDADSSEVKLVSSGGMPYINIQRGDSVLGDWKLTAKGNGSQQVLATSLGTSDLITVQADGNLGIGTTSPARLLSVEDSSSNAFISIVSKNDSRSAILLGDTDSDSQGRIDYDNSDNHLHFSTAATERMRIDSSGNVGIGTTSPDTPLHVPQPSTTIGGADVTNGALLIGSSTQGIGIDDNEIISTGHSGLNIGTYKQTGQANAYIRFMPAQAEAMRITDGGNVGIGTTTPAGTLELSSTATDVNLYMGGTPVSGGREPWRFQSEGDYLHIGQNKSSFAQYMTFHGSSVGIGTTTPSQKLHVYGTTLLESANAKLCVCANGKIEIQATVEVDDDGGTKGLWFGDIGESQPKGYIGGGAYAVNGLGTNDFGISSSAGNNLAFGIGGVEKIRINSLGNVGIGTTTPESTLHVAGKATIQSSGPVLVLKDTDGGDVNSQNGFIDYRDQNDVQRGYVGFGSSTNKEFSIWNMIGDIRLGTGTTVNMRIKENGTVEIPGNLVVTGKTTTNNVETVSTSNGVVFEGSATDDHEGTLKAGTLTADRAYTLPNQSGTVAMTSDIKNSAITITAGNALTGGGTLNLNQSSAETITIDHQDTSSQGSSNNSGRTYIQDINLDSYGHVTSIGTATETVVASNAAITITAGNALTGGGTLNLNQSSAETITIDHQDTSSQGSSNNSGRTYIQDITLDTYGHVTGIGTATETVINTDTNTTYTAGNHLTLTGTEFSVNRDLRGGTDPSTGVYAIGQNNQSYFMIHGIFSKKAETYLGGNLISKLEEDGDLHIEGDVVAFSTTVSDEKFKDNIGQIKGGLEKVKKLRGVEFDWNATSRKGTKDIGVIAQEVEQVIPEVVSEKVPCVGEFCENTEKYKTVDYAKLVPVLIEAIKDLSEEVEELKKKLS